MNETDLKRLLIDRRVIQENGGHLFPVPAYFYSHPDLFEQLAQLIATKFLNQRFEVVVSADSRSAILGMRVATILQQHGRRGGGAWHEVFHITLDELPGSIPIVAPVNKQFLNGRSVLVISDLVIPGPQSRRSLEAVKQAGGTVYGVTTICDLTGRFNDIFDTVPTRHALVSLAKEPHEAAA